MVQEICMFFQKTKPNVEKSLKFGPQWSKHYIFGNYFYLKNARNLRFHVFFLFHARKHNFIILPAVDRINKKLWILFQLLVPTVNLNKFTVSCEFGPLQIKLWYHMFSSFKMEGCMAFWTKLVAKNIVLGSPGTHFYAYEG